MDCVSYGSFRTWEVDRSPSEVFSVRVSGHAKTGCPADLSRRRMDE